MPLAAGTKLGPYEIVAPLGAGGMGEVYRARDTRLGRDVAVKVLPDHLSSNPEIRARFEREAKTVSSLNHPHICTLHDIGRERNTDFLVMELVEGETLAQRLAKGALPLPDLLKFGIQIADALDRAHRAGVMHRDLKPGNVMLTRSGAKLLDFGLARGPGLGAASDLTSSPTVAAPLTTEGTILGTFQYMAPEQLEGAEADPRADLWALGCVLYEMATGQPAFAGKSQASLISAIMTAAPVPVSQRAPTTPPALDHLIRACLAKDPEERIQTAHDVRLQLQWIAEGGSQVGAPAVAAAGRPGRRWGAWAGWAVGAIGVALALASLLKATGAPREERVTRTIVPAPENAMFLFTGDNGGPAVVSPDGMKLAFVAVDANGSQLWVRDLSSLAAEAIPATSNATYPFWSADGRSVGFFADGKLKRVDLATRQVIGLCAAPAGRGGTWSASDVIVFSPDFQADLFQIPAMGGTPVLVTKRGDGQTTFRWPHFLPDGKHVLYYSGNHLNIGGPENALWVVSLDGRENRVIGPSATEAEYADGYLVYVQDSALVARPFDPGSARFTGESRSSADRVQFDPTTWKANFSISSAGLLVYQPTGGKQGSEIRLYDRSGTMVRRVAEGGNHFNVRISRDGRFVTYSSQLNPNGDVFAYDVERGLGRRLTSNEADEDLPMMSADDRSIVFTQRHSEGGKVGRYAIERMDVGGGASRTVAKGEKDLWPLDVSPDGRRLLVGTGNFSLQVTETIGVVSSDGTGPIRTVESERGLIFSARFSGDGRWAAYGLTSNGESNVYIAEIAEGSTPRRIQISSRGGMLPQWGAGDRELVYVRGDGMVVGVPLAPGTMEPGPEKELFRVVLRPGTASFDMSADAQRFAVDTLASEGAAPIVVLTNWKRELEKR